MTVREVGRYVNMSTTGRRLPASVWSEDGQQRASGPSLTSSSRQNLPIRLVQQSLMVLIQHHCVLHSSQVHGGADLAQSSQDEYFEANVDEILARLRFGTYLALAHEWGGDEAEAVVRLLLYHGQMRAGDLMDELSGSGGQMNGVASGRKARLGVSGSSWSRCSRTRLCARPRLCNTSRAKTVISRTKMRFAAPLKAFLRPRP